MLAPSGGGLILYQAYGNLYAMTGSDLVLQGPTRQILDFKGAIPSMKDVDAKEIKKVNERSYAAQVGCESCNGPHYTKDCPLKEEGKTLEEAYYTRFGVPFPQGGRYRASTLGFYQRDNGNPSYQEQRQTMEESLSKVMVESTKRHNENSNLIKEIRASTNDAMSVSVLGRLRSEWVDRRGVGFAGWGSWRDMWKLRGGEWGAQDERRVGGENNGEGETERRGGGRRGSGKWGRRRRRSESTKRKKCEDEKDYRGGKRREKGAGRGRELKKGGKRAKRGEACRRGGEEKGRRNEGEVGERRKEKVQGGRNGKRREDRRVKLHRERGVAKKGRKELLGGRKVEKWAKEESEKVEASRRKEKTRCGEKGEKRRGGGEGKGGEVRERSEEGRKGEEKERRRWREGGKRAETERVGRARATRREGGKHGKEGGREEGWGEQVRGKMEKGKGSEGGAQKGKKGGRHSVKEGGGVKWSRKRRG
ncbi:hypothetical protein Tco_1032313 [Tanacetum coccineum]|uniref:Eukaryotic translation initiation factor 3 subunit G N-terminal domain-containing protein n=1 Tax=Tanacetum coccineum TaxID=301880 RepID=A0ABQ5GDU0_9ASTR